MMNRAVMIAAALCFAGCSREPEAPPPAPTAPRVKATMSLRQAAEAGDMAQMEAHFKRRSDVNARGADGRTPLQAAVDADQPKAVQALLAHGADSNATDGLGRTIVDQAVEADAAGVVRALPGADKGALLRLAALNGSVKVAAELLKRGAPVDSADPDGMTPLHAAARRGHAAMVELLLEKGANPRVADKNGVTPLHLAVRHGRTAALLAKGANTKDGAGRTALHLAAANGDVDVVRALLAAGADARMQGPDGTAVEIALRCGNIHAWRVLAGGQSK